MAVAHFSSETFDLNQSKPIMSSAFSAVRLIQTNRIIMRKILALVSVLLLSACAGQPLKGTGDLGLVIERASGHVTLVNTSSRT
ncbi:MAG: protein NirF, partial [Pseudomonadota bacterium]|nr:protein NirF [Pseudomonadota bacterium]